MIYLNVSNSYRSLGKTGIQRVVRELARRLNDEECRLVVIHKSIIYDVSDNIHDFLSVQSFELEKELTLDVIQPADLYLDLDASWGDPGDYRNTLLSIKKRGCIMVRMNHDVVPIIYPKYSHPNTVFRFSERLADDLRIFDYWICASQIVKRDLQRVASEFGADIFEPALFELGSDIPTPSSSNQNFEPRIPKGRFALAVGTIEPRKNYELVLASYDALLQDAEFGDVSLVLVGKSGWNNDAIVKAIQNHPQYGNKLIWLKDACDAELDALYRAANLCLCLSHYEGFGLPAVEALTRQLPVICTEGSAMQEVIKGQACAVPLQPQPVCEAMKSMLRHKPEIHFTPVSWDESARQLKQILNQWLPAPTEPIAIRQAVYISIRSKSLLRSINSLVNAPFITQVVILTSDAMAPELEALFADHRLDVRIHSESEIGLTTLPDDHLERNTLLRRLLYRQDFIDPHFLAFDDDYVVLHPIGTDVFVQEDGRQCAYFYEEDGRNWLGALPRPTSFDQGLWRTMAYLEGSGYPCRLYNAHQPQIIDKALATQILERTKSHRLDEWSSYFNIACHLLPWAFVATRYVSAGWPENFDSWLCPAPEVIHFYNDPPDGQDWEQAAARWREQLQQTIDSWGPYPSLVLQDGELAFHPPRINLGNHPRVFAPVLSDQPMETLSYAFLGESRKFSWPNIPSFLSTPGNRLRSASYSITATVTVGGKTLQATLEIAAEPEKAEHSA